MAETLPGDGRAAHTAGMNDHEVHLHITTPDELVALIPYWLGYHPHDNVVILAQRHGRVELGCALTIDQVGQADVLADLADMLSTRVGDAMLMVVGYGPARSTDEAVACVEIALGAQQIDISLVVSDRRFWVRSAGERVEWSPGHRFDPRASVAATAAVSAGLQVLGGRDQVSALVAGPGADDRAIADAWRTARQQASAWSPGQREEFLDDCLTRSVDHAEDLSRDELTQLGALVQCLELRDRAWLAMDSVGAWRHQQLWLAVVALTPPSAAAPVLCLTAVAAWLGGGGAVFTECLVRCEQVDPDYSMLAVLREVHDLAVPPSMWKRMGRDRRDRHRRLRQPAPPVIADPQAS